MTLAELVPYFERLDAARLVFDFSVGAFVVGEFSQALRVRHGAVRTNLGAEALFRAMFFGGILLIPLGRAVAPNAAITGGIWTFSIGVLIGWFGVLLRPPVSRGRAADRLHVNRSGSPPEAAKSS